MLVTCFNYGTEMLSKNRWNRVFLLRAVLILVNDCPWLATLLKVRSRKGLWIPPPSYRWPSVVSLCTGMNAASRKGGSVHEGLWE